MNRSIVLAEWHRARESLRAAETLTGAASMPMQSRELIVFYTLLRPGYTFMT